MKFTNELWMRKRTIVNETNSRSTTNQHRSVMTSSQKLIDLLSNVQRPSVNSKVIVQNAEQLMVPDQKSLPNDHNELKVLFETELAKIISWLQTHCQRHDKQIELDLTLMSLLPLLWKNDFQEVIKTLFQRDSNIRLEVLNQREK
jgi:hypothetical protein